MYPWGETDVVLTRGFAGSMATMADAAALGLEGAPSVPCQQAKPKCRRGFDNLLRVDNARRHHVPTR